MRVHCSICVLISLVSWTTCDHFLLIIPSTRDHFLGICLTQKASIRTSINDSLRGIRPQTRSVIVGPEASLLV